MRIIKTRREEIHKKNLRVLDTIRTDQNFKSEDEEKNREKPDNQNFYPPEP